MIRHVTFGYLISILHDELLLLLHPCRGAVYCDQFVCVSVCPRAYLWKRWTDRHEFLSRPAVAVMSSCIASCRTTTSRSFSAYNT